MVYLTFRPKRPDAIPFCVLGAGSLSTLHTKACLLTSGHCFLRTLNRQRTSPSYFAGIPIQGKDDQRRNDKSRFILTITIESQRLLNWWHKAMIKWSRRRESNPQGTLSLTYRLFGAVKSFQTDLPPYSALALGDPLLSYPSIRPVKRSIRVTSGSCSLPALFSATFPTFKDITPRLSAIPARRDKYNNPHYGGVVYLCTTPLGKEVHEDGIEPPQSLDH